MQGISVFLIQFNVLKYNVCRSAVQVYTSEYMLKNIFECALNVLSVNKVDCIMIFTCWANLVK